MSQNKYTQPKRMYGSARMTGDGPEFGHPPRRPRWLIPALAALIVIAVVILIVALSGDKPPEDVTAFAADPSPSAIIAMPVQTPGNSLDEIAGPFLDEPPEEALPTEAEALGLRPTAAPGGYLPIFVKAKTTEKIVAITVDDCNQAHNLDGIVDSAVVNGGKITIFPIARNLQREALQVVVRKAHQLGMQFENHSYSHSTFYNLSAEKMASEIYDANRALSYVLDVNYQMRFMRTRGGDNRRDLRTHQYIEALGYYGMAHWSVDGSRTEIDKLKAGVEPGNIYLFHTTDGDLAKLLEFIPYLKAQGYRMVTLNEMFGYPPNAESEITTPIKDLEVPAPEPYVYAYKQLERGDFLWDVYLMQERLNELGWLKSKPDGEYGKNTYQAVGYFQLAAAIKADGKASPETQEAIFAEGALHSGDGKKPLASPAPTLDPAAPIPTTAPRVTAAAVVDMTLVDGR